MTYYEKNAFIGGQEWPNPLIPAMQRFYQSIKKIDLRQFPRCEEYIAIGHTNFTPSPEELEQKKWRGNQIEEKKRQQNIHRHYYYNQCNALILITMFSALLRFFGWLFLLDKIFYSAYRAITTWDTSPLWFTYDDWLYILGFYLPGLYLKYKERKHSHKNGATFNRQTGMVQIYEEGVEKLIEFRDFIPLASRRTAYNTNPFYETCIRSHSNGIVGTVIIKINGSLAAGVIEYNFLRHYMDVTRPLPDVPELECYRQFDPVTKAHDKKTGRDPYYWRHMTRNEYNRLFKESFARAQAILGPRNFRAI